MHHIVNNIMKANDPLISVIVPIYNVEPYVRKCLGSLQHQTMREIEVICIDDGSTDKSGEIAEEYSSNSLPFFRVIHTENRGLSAARNRGVDESRAPWLMFVDSDDWVDNRFCEIPYREAMENDADLVIFRTYIMTEAGKVKKEKSRENKAGIVKTEDVILNCVAWNKLYRKSLFEGIRYPEGHVYEDIATTYKFIDRAKTIYLCEDRLYYYRKRKHSICSTISNKSDEYCARRERYLDLTSAGYPEDKVKNDYLMAALRYCGQAADAKDPIYCEATGIIKAIKGIPDGFNRKSTIKLLVWRISKNLYRTIYRITGKRMVDVSRYSTDS